MYFKVQTHHHSRPRENCGRCSRRDIGNMVEVNSTRRRNV